MRGVVGSGLTDGIQVSEEIFDVCNERDEVIGQGARADIHRFGLRHRAVHVLVFNSRGEVFLQKRSMSKDTFPGAWDSSASGHLGTGEDYDACAVRELREEIGVEVERPLQRLFKIEACAETGQEHVWVYRCDCEGPFCLHPEEVERGEWFSVERINELIRERSQDFATGFIHLWPRILEMSSR
jgi:isopentenyl-diphosphate delta-isomerase